MKKLLLMVVLTCSLRSSRCWDVHISENLGQNTKNCSKLESPCKTIDYGYRIALEQNSLEQLNLILLGNYEMNETLHINIAHASLRTLKICSRNQTEIVGGPLGCIILGCKDNTSCIEYDVVFENITFGKFYQQTAISAFHLPRLIVTNCRFSQTNNSALKLFDSAVDIENCTFTGGRYNNKSNTTGQWIIGGMVGVIFSATSNKSVVIGNSVFLNNTANLNLSKYRENFANPFTDFSYFGGSVAVLFLNSSTSNRVVIDGCYFEGNRALFGGAFSINILQNAKRNAFDVSNSTLIENHADISGGGFCLKTFDDASNNAITFRNVSFVKNIAQASAGAGKFVLGSIDNEPLPPTFVNTNFIENRAKTGAALDIGKLLRDLRSQWRRAVVFENVEFKNNSVLSNYSFIHTGTVSAYNVDLRFHGTNSFLSNRINSPLFVCGANVNVSGSLLFAENIAYYSGGGMSLVDGSSLLLMPGSNLTFYQNYAAVCGGAIHYQGNVVEKEVFPFNPTCFIQYGVRNVAASNWNVTMNFIRNGAGFKGSAIHTTTINQCRWIESYPYYSTKKVFRWSKSFFYTGNYVGSFTRSSMSAGNELEDIATDAYSYQYAGAKDISIYPGASIELQISGIDELNSSIDTLATVLTTDFWKNGSRAHNSSINIKNRVFSTATASSNNTIQYSMASEEDYNLIEDGKENKIHTVDIIDYSSIYGARVRLAITPIPCAPGYKFDSTTLKCICDKGITGLTRCQGPTIRLKNGIWANVSQKYPGKLVTFQCPKSYCECQTGDEYQSDCQFNPKKPNEQCIDDRDGILCGKCKIGASITLPSYSCKTCNISQASTFALYIAVLIVTILACLGIIYYNPSMSEYLKGIFFFTQILPYVFTTSDSSAAIAETFSTVINSVVVGSLPVEMCLFEGLDLIDAIGVSYIIPTVCAFILVIVFLLSKFRLLNFHRDSPFNAFWMLIIVIYKLLVETAMKSLACFTVDDDLVFFYDGSVKCFSSEHLALFIPSAIILVVVVIPLPIVIVLTSFGYIRAPPPVRDIMSKGYRNDCRWWCAFDLVRRMAFCAVYTFVPDWSLKQALFIFLSVFVCFTHSVSSPYQNNLANHGETFLLASLCLIAALQATSDESIRETGSLIALSITMIYTGIVIAYLLSGLAARLVRRWKRKMDQGQMNQSPRDMHGRPYNVPKRVAFEKPVFRSNQREIDSDKENLLQQPLIQGSPPEEL